MRRTAGVRFDPERAEVRTLRGAPVRGGRVLDAGCGDGRLTRRIVAADVVRLKVFRKRG